MIKLGITGGIGSGKSVVCTIFKCLGIPVFRADDEGRRLLNEDTVVKNEVVKLFGPSVIINGQPDRKKIASLVFADKEKLLQLNSIIHPAVRSSFEHWLSEQTSQIIIEEVAIMFESGAYKGLDAVLVVTAPEKLRIERVMSRDGVTETEVRKRMQNQMSDEEKVKRATYVVVNDGTTMLIPAVLDIYKTLLKGHSAKKD